MNKERILALADLIEKLPKGSVYGEKSGFDMTDFSHHCGTPACIGGWARWEHFGRPDDIASEIVASQLSYSEVAAGYLGIDLEATAEELFYPPTIDNWQGITPQHAAAVLRNLVETGEVDWNAGATAGRMDTPDADT